MGERRPSIPCREDAKEQVFLYMMYFRVTPVTDKLSSAYAKIKCGDVTKLSFIYNQQKRDKLGKASWHAQTPDEAAKALAVGAAGIASMQIVAYACPVGKGWPKCPLTHAALHPSVQRRVHSHRMGGPGSRSASIGKGRWFEARRKGLPYEGLTGTR
ncbi:hypothetical protein UY3_07120 [Chelonia mydas]|uniref:Uncharacterized protein n=1 Tax=Chelonia mydas TaxID=8469 RepID=M7BUE9_CHEMY|nr:hypothetical protein UY3_07120 [Chelonia mydas]